MYSLVEKIIGYTALTIFVVIVMYGIFSQEHVSEYYLTCSGNDIAIGVIVENGVDAVIPLQNVTPVEAVAIINELNQSLTENR